MKKLLSLLLAAAMLLSLTACGSGEPDPNAGVYEAVSAEMLGISVGVEDLFSDGFTLTLKDGGKAVFHYDGKDYSIKWSLDGDRFHASGSGAELNGTLHEGVLVLENVLDSGIQITLVDPTKQTSAQPEPQPEPGETPEPVLDAWATLPEVDDETTADWSFINNYGLGLIEDEVYYGRYFVKGENHSMLVRIDLAHEGTDILAAEWKILDDSCWPNNLWKRGDALYYLMEGRDDSGCLGIARINTDGSDRRVLYEGDCAFLQLLGDRMYFTDEQAHLVSTDLEGGDRKVLLEREVYYTFLLNEDWVIFQDDADNESLHLFYFPDQIDVKLNDERSYEPLISGSRLFYSTPDEENPAASHMCMIDLSAWEPVLDENLGCHVPAVTIDRNDALFGGDYYVFQGQIWVGNNSGSKDLQYWKNLEDTGYERWERVIRYISEDYEIEDVFDDEDDSLVMGIMFHDRHSNYGNNIPWLR